MRIKIIADSTNDLSTELLEKYDIRNVAGTIVLGEKDFKDGLDIQPKELFAFIDSGKGNTHTSAINTAEYLAVYQEELGKGADAILHFTISGELSSGFDNALLATNEIENVYPIDTRHLSTGGGWLVLYAADLIAAGLDAAEIAARCGAQKRLIDTSFILDTLEYMRKGGRCSGFKATSAQVLKIKPCLEMRDGKLEVCKKYRGSMKKVLASYLQDRLADVDNINRSRAFITHTCYDDPDFVSEAVRICRELFAFDELLITGAGCTVANHCGPGTIGVLFSHER